MKIFNVKILTFWWSGQFDENTNSIGFRQCTAFFCELPRQSRFMSTPRFVWLLSQTPRPTKAHNLTSATVTKKPILSQTTHPQQQLIETDLN